MTPQQAFEDHHKAVYRFVYRLVGRADVAEDVTQDCFLALLSHPERWDANRGSMKTFLFSVARNLAFKRFRDEGWSDVADADSTCEPAATGDQELSVLVAQAVAQLAPLQREALILFEYEGLQLAEIAAVVGADVNAVKARLHRARAYLKRALAPCRSQVRKVGAA